MVEDWSMLEHTLRYLKAAVDKPIVLLCTDASMRVHANMDVAFALYENSITYWSGNIHWRIYGPQKLNSWD